MSTHGAVAVGDLKRWKGVVDYWDGNPEGLGQDLWNKLADRLNRVQDSQITAELQKFGREVLKSGRWETFAGRPNPGEKTKRWIVTSDQPEPLGMQWVYIINPEKQVVHVLTSLSYEWTAPPKHLEVSLHAGVLRKGPVKLRNGRWHYGHMILKDYHLTDIDLNAQTVNMGAIQDEADKNYERLSPKCEKVFGFFDSQFAKRLIRQAGNRFTLEAQQLGFKSTDLGKTFQIDDDGDKTKYKLVGLVRDKKNRPTILVHTPGMKVYEQLDVKTVQQALGGLTPAALPPAKVLPKERMQLLKGLSITA